jgi:hypothetical protein
MKENEEENGSAVEVSASSNVAIAHAVDAGAVVAEAIPELTAVGIAEIHTLNEAGPDPDSPGVFSVLKKVWFGLGYIIMLSVSTVIIIVLLIAHISTHIFHIFGMFVGKNLWNIHGHDRGSGLACVFAMMCLLVGAPFVLVGYVCYFIAYGTLQCLAKLPIVGENMRDRAEEFHIYDPSADI